MKTYEQYLAVILRDARWAADQEFRKKLLLGLFTQRTRLSVPAAFLWAHVIEFFWDRCQTVEEVAATLGCKKIAVRQIIRMIRCEAARLLNGAVPNRRAAVVRAESAIDANPESNSPAHWERVLAACGFASHESRTQVGRSKRPIYRYFGHDTVERAFTISFPKFFDSFEADIQANAQAHLPTVWGGPNSWNLSEVEHAIDANWARKHNRQISGPAKAGEQFLAEFDRLEAGKLANLIAPFRENPDDGRAIQRETTGPKLGSPIGRPKLAITIDGKQINHSKYGRGEILRVVGETVCCSFVLAGRVNLKLDSIKRNTGFNIQKTQKLHNAVAAVAKREMPARETSDSALLRKKRKSFLFENEMEIIPSELLCSQSVQQPAGASAH